MSRPYVRSSPDYVGGFQFKREQILTLDAFAGGMNNVEPDGVVEDNESTDSKNMMFVSNSLMQKRFGTKYVNQTAYPDITTGSPAVGVPIVWVDEYRPTLGDSQIVRATMTELYIGSTKICDVQGKVRGVNYIGKYYFVDGKNLYVYDGMTYYIVSDTHSYTTEEVAANGKTFTLKYIPPHVTDTMPLYIILGSTNVNLDIQTIDRVNNTITVVTGHTAKIPKETVVYFYEPLASGTYVEGTEVWDETTHYAYYEPCRDQLNDTFAGTPYLPDSPDVIAVHQDRIFLAGDTEQPHGVYMSANANISPLYFPSGAGVSAKPNGERVVDLVVFDSALIIGRHNDMYVLYGNSEYQNLTDEPFYIKQMDVSIGFMCADCGALINNFYIFLGYDGRFYKLNTPTTFVEYLMTKPMPYKINLYKAPFNQTIGATLDVSAVNYYNEVLFNIGTDLVLVYNFDTMGWTYYTGWNSKSLHTDGINLYIGRADGKLTMYDNSGDNFDDMGNPVHALFATKRFDFGSSATYKYFTRFMMSASAWEDKLSYIGVSIEVDLKDIDDAYNISSNMTKFGISEWGVTHFNDKELIKSGWRMLDIRGRTIKFIFENGNLNEPFRIYDVNLGYSLRDVR